jgi:hypothetical protein
VRVFHFLRSEHGLNNLRLGRLKVSQLDDLNDPFECFSADLSERKDRESFMRMKSHLASISELICFSRGWSNPVMWSHYAERHRGVCLGFEVPSEGLIPVRYISRRKKLCINELSIAKTKELLATKHSHWRYEDEVRYFRPLSQPEEDGRRYAKFGSDLRLTTVIIGSCSSLSRAEVEEALGTRKREVDLFKARLAFRQCPEFCVSAIPGLTASAGKQRESYRPTAL